jgi:cytosine/adenosine deaminase-related metal-dependent hydrolase
MTPDKTLLRGGSVITLDNRLGNFARADLLITGSTITTIAPQIDVSDALVIDVSDMIVMPGFVDAHRHTWQGALKQIAPDANLGSYFTDVLGALAPRYRAEDVYVGTLLGALEALDAGITTLFDWSHIQHTPAHSDAAVQALRDAGLRAVFGYGFPNTGAEWFYESRLAHPRDARRVRDRYFASDDQLVTMAMAVRGPELSTMDVTRHDWALARELGLRMSVHVGNGAFGVPYRAIERLSDAALLGPDTQYVHNVSLTDSAIVRIRDTGGTVVTTPAVELQMGFGMPAAGRLLKCGLRPGLGIDVITSTAGDLFTQMRATYQIERVLAAQTEGERPMLSPADVLAMATIDGAHATWLDHKVGSLSPGKQADIVLLRTNSLHLSPINDLVGAVVLSAGPGDVDTVLVAGRVVKRHGVLLGVDLTRLRTDATASRAYLVGAAASQSTSSPRQSAVHCAPTSSPMSHPSRR